ncbi:hypothetical protein BDR03DRAFT_964174, partial [Suillus americanus]
MAAIFVCCAKLCLSLACTDRHRCCQSNSGEGGETHFLCEVIWNLLKVISNDISEDGGTLNPAESAGSCFNSM